MSVEGARLGAAVALGAALLAGAGGVARAQPSVGAQRYESGTRLYATRHYVEAAYEFEAAYALSQDPVLLFNAGRAWEEARDVERALDAYARFEASGAPGYNVGDLRLRIARLRAVRTMTAPRVAVAPSLRVAPPGPAHRASPRPFAVGAVVTMAVGGAVVLGAVPLWVSARATYDELASGCPGRACAAVQEADARRASGFAAAGDVLLGVGVAGVVAGVTWLLLSRPATETAGVPRVTIDCHRGGCAAGVAGAF